MFMDWLYYDRLQLVFQNNLVARCLPAESIGTTASESDELEGSGPRVNGGSQVNQDDGNNQRLLGLKCMMLVELYIFAEQHETPQLRDDVLDAIEEVGLEHELLPGDPVVQRVCDALPSTSSLYQYLAELYAVEVDGKTLSHDEVEALPKEFLVEAFMACKRYRHKPYVEGVSRLHERTNGKKRKGALP